MYPAHPQLHMSNAGLAPSHEVMAIDEFGEQRAGHIAGERPLTLFLNKREIVTLMTLGTHPELLTLGYLRNQRLVEDVTDITDLQVVWDVDAVAVTTRRQAGDLEEKLSHRTVTTGCGQGTVFGKISEQLEQLHLPQRAIRQSELYGLLDNLNEFNEVYRRAGGVHGCALCHGTDIELFVEDVGRHNAADAIAGHMWLHDLDGAERIFYTTGRLTSEMVIKVAQMGIPILLSRSGLTQQGLVFARQVGVTLIARAKGQHFLVYNGADNLVFDAKPKQRPQPAARRAHAEGGRIIR
jgi:FdhD protein